MRQGTRALWPGEMKSSSKVKCSWALRVLTTSGLACVAGSCLVVVLSSVPKPPQFTSHPPLFARSETIAAPTALSLDGGGGDSDACVASRGCTSYWRNISLFPTTCASEGTDLCVDMPQPSATQMVEMYPEVRLVDRAPVELLLDAVHAVDYIKVMGSKMLHLAWFTPARTLISPPNPGMKLQFALYEGLRFHPRVTLTSVFGPGFCGSASCAREDEYRNVDFMLVEGLHSPKAYGYTADALQQLRSMAVPKLALFHECRGDTYNCCPLIEEYNISVALMTGQAHEARSCTSESKSSVKRLYVHIPISMFIPWWTFFRAPSAARKHVALLVGKLGDKYVLRERVFNMISNGKLQNTVYLRKTRGRTALSSYLSALTSVKVVIVDSSCLHVTLRKYSEAACAGALVLGEAVDDMPELVGPLFVQIPRLASDQDLKTLITKWLDDDAMRISFATKAQTYCIAHFSAIQAAIHAHSAMVDFLNGYRGVKNDFPGRESCQCTINSRFHVNGMNRWCHS